MERQYKNSGIEWIGRIPSDWNMQPLSIYFTENRKPNSDLGTVNALQFKYGEIIQKPSNGKELTDKDRELLEKYTVVIPDDIVVNGLNLNYDLKSLRIAKVRENGIITSAYIVLRPRNGANASYYNYYLKALDYQKIFHGMGVGIRLTLSYNELRSMLLPVPSADEQLLIAEYLDEKCVEIDGLIALQEKMIAQLTDYKQSVITEAVTKGLNPDAQLAPSGIDWIDTIPKGWKNVRFYYSNWIRGRLGWKGLKSEEYTESGYPFLSAFNIINNKLDWSDINYINQERYDESPEIKLNEGDILLVKDGAGIGKCARIDELPLGESTVNSSLAVITPKAFLNYKYLYYYLQSNSFWSIINLLLVGMGVPHLTQTNMKNIKMPLPPLEEQVAIAEYLDTKCGEIDRLIETKRQKIETLKEYKKSVIYEAVTGKTDLRDS